MRLTAVTSRRRVAEPQFPAAYSFMPSHAAERIDGV
jgi:hypothetical protein